MTTSAPCSRGRDDSGVEKVASTHTSAPVSWAAAARVGMSTTPISGLVVVSSQSSDAPGRAARTASLSVMSTERTSIRPSNAWSANSEIVPA